MSVTAEGWENRKLVKVQRVDVKSVLEGSQGHADFVALIKVTTTVNHLFHLTVYGIFEEGISNQSESLYRQGINFTVKKHLNSVHVSKITNDSVPKDQSILYY